MGTRCVVTGGCNVAFGCKVALRVVVNKLLSVLEFSFFFCVNLF